MLCMLLVLYYVGPVASWGVMRLDHTILADIITLERQEETVPKSQFPSYIDIELLPQVKTSYLIDTAKLTITPDLALSLLAFPELLHGHHAEYVLQLLLNYLS